MRKLIMMGISALFAISLWGYDVGDYSYSYNMSTKEGTITGYGGTSSNISIPMSFTVPETYKDEDDGEMHTRYHTIHVVGIGSSVFANKTFIKSVSFHSKLKSVGSSAFSGCTGIVEVDLSTVETIGDNAFRGCTSLTDIDIPSSASSMGSGIFESCTKLKEVRFHNDLRGTIPSRLFNGCANLVSVSISIPNVSSIGDYAFSGCKSLGFGNVDFNNLKSVGAYAFQGCLGLTGVTFSSGLTSIGEHAFDSCANLSQTLETPLTLKSFGSFAFTKCSGLTQIVIDGNGVSVGAGAFSECSNIVDVVIGDGVVGIAGNMWRPNECAFHNCGKIKTIHVGVGVTIIGQSVFEGLGALEYIEFDGELTEIGMYAFSGCAKLKDFKASNARLTRIADYAFDCCYQLPKLDCSLEYVTSIGEQAFEHCGQFSLDGVAFQSLESVSRLAFWYCSGITTLKFGPKLKGFTSNAFASCNNLNSVIFAGPPPEVGTHMFSPGAVFEGCASGAHGYYPPVYAAEWQDVINPSTKKWQGLIMEEIPRPVLNVPVVNEVDATVDLSWSMDYTSANLRFDVYRSDGPDFASASAVGENVTEKFFKDDAWSQSYGKSEALYYWVVGKDGDLWMPSEMATAVVRLPEFEFAVDLQTGCASVKKYRGTSQTVWIPEVAYFDKSGVQLPAAASSAGEAYPVTGIESTAFANNKTLQELYIPDSVETIGECAFLGCEKLLGVKLGKGIKRIPPYAFAYLKALEKVVVGGCITEDIGGYAFAGCTSLKEIVGGGMRPTSVFLDAFYHVPAEFSIDFSDCTFIGPEAFCGCKGFWGSGYAEPLSLPKITEIWDSAFEGCESILGLWCGKELKCIGSRAFSESGMCEVRFDGKPPESVGEDAFGDLSTIPEGVASTYYFSEWRTVISDTGMWHGVHFPLYDQHSDDYGWVAYSLVAFDDNDQTNSLFDARRVTAIVAKHIKGPGGREILMEVDRRFAAFDAIELRPHVYGYGDFEVWFEYDDGSWASTIRYDAFTVPIEGVRRKTIYFRRAGAEWTLNVQLYDEKNKKLPFASRSYSSGAKPELGTADVIVPLYTLPEPSVAKPSALFGDYALRWYYYKDDDKVGELINTSAISIYGWDDERLTGKNLRLFAKWEWYLLESEREKMNELLTGFKFKEDGGVFYNSFAYDGETKELAITVDEGSGGRLSFDWKTSCEGANGSGEFRDHTEFLVDGEVIATSDGESVWKRVSVDLSGGKLHTVTWRYVKDGSGSEGEDCVWISDIQFASLADEESSGDLLDESDYNWFYETTPTAFTESEPFEYNPVLTPENVTCQIDICAAIGEVESSALLEEDVEDAQAAIVKVAGAFGLDYAVLTSDGWTMVGNGGLGAEGDDGNKISVVIDYAAKPSKVKYMVSGHTLTNADGVALFECAAQKSSVQTLVAKGDGTIDCWAGKYEVVNSDVQFVEEGSEIELAANLDTFPSETFQVSGGGTLVIPSDKIPVGGVNRKLHVDGNSKVRFDLSGSGTIPSVTRLFNGVGGAFVIGDNIQLVVPGEGVERVSKLFVKDGNLEARVAERPTIDDGDGSDSAFKVNADSDSTAVSASIGNAVEGFWYGLLTTGVLTSDFVLDPDSVKQCTGTGSLRLESSANANSDFGFYRASVSAEKP